MCVCVWGGPEARRLANGERNVTVVLSAPWQIYVHIPGSEKLILELPLVIGTAGLGSRSNSVSSQEGSVSNASQSWVSLRMPSEPPSYCDITRDCRLDQPLTPLLDDFDGEDSPIFMNVPAFQYPPPPAYAEVGTCTRASLTDPNARCIA